jgi:hypothetical protein
MTSIAVPAPAVKLLHDVRLQAEKRYSEDCIPAGVHDRYVETYAATVLADRLVRAEQRIRDLERTAP